MVHQAPKNDDLPLHPADANTIRPTPLMLKKEKGSGGMGVVEVIMKGNCPFGFVMVSSF